LERPFVKLFEEEEDLAVHLLLDGSNSMDWPSSSILHNKWGYARQLAAALGYIALVTSDRLTVANLQSPISNPQSPISNPQSLTPNPQSPFPNPQPQFGPCRGRGHTLRLLEWLEELEAEGVTNLNGTLRVYAISGGRPGLVVLISDLFSPSGYGEGLTALAARGHEVAVIHVLAPDEMEPPLAGDLRLLDVETGEPQEVTIDGGMRALYRRRLAAWRDDIRATCRARDIHYVPVETDTPFDRVVLYDLRRSGLVR
jgi:uncharacterized protein (DUF58 family)